MEATRQGERVDMDVADLGSRWPEFAKAMVGRGLPGGLSMTLVSGERHLGSLNLYSSSREVFSAAEAERAEFFADHAATVLANAVDLATAELVNEQLQEALVTREVVGQAKGILLVQQGLSGDEAFDMLRKASQRSNRKVRDIAAELVESTRASRNAEG